MTKWADKWNALPLEIRHIGAMVSIEDHINHLLVERERLKNRYQQSVREIDHHIETLKSELRKGDEP